MHDLVLANGRIVDPASGVDRVADLAIDAGRVAALGEGLPGRERVDCTGLVVCPGFVDLHVHLRDPGQEWKEDLISGGRAAAAGGFTTICCMPNTDPTLDTGAVVRDVVERAAAAAVRIRPVGAITRGLAGERLAEIGEMVAAGAVAISDDGRGVQDGRLMRRALEYARPLGIPVAIHAQDDPLFGDGVMNEGWRATELGLAGIPAAAEETQIDRDIRLCRLTGTPLHVAHISTAGGVELVARAQAAGLPVSAEATPHHLLLTDEQMPAYDTNWKMSPPLRSPADREAVVAALAAGTIAAIATD
ncbi:MAG: dihydroorotase, partial [Nitrospirae bacterium]